MYAAEGAVLQCQALQREAGAVEYLEERRCAAAVECDSTGAIDDDAATDLLVGTERDRAAATECDRAAAAAIDAIERRIEVRFIAGSHDRIGGVRRCTPDPEQCQNSHALEQQPAHVR